jgi:hypothetical protein
MTSPAGEFAARESVPLAVVLKRVAPQKYYADFIFSSLCSGAHTSQVVAWTIVFFSQGGGMKIEQAARTGESGVAYRRGVSDELRMYKLGEEILFVETEHAGETMFAPEPISNEEMALDDWLPLGCRSVAARPIKKTGPWRPYE